MGKNLESQYNDLLTQAGQQAEESGQVALAAYQALAAAREWLRRFGGQSPIQFGGEAELDTQLAEAMAQMEQYWPSLNEDAIDIKHRIQCGEPPLPQELPEGYTIEQEDEDTFYLIYQGMTTGYDFTSEFAARTFCWKRHNEGRIPMKSEWVI
jgi:hypothetical protein